MEKIIQIFSQLGVDQSIFHQFVVFLVLFFALKAVLFNRLLEVLQLREQSTSKKEGDANKKMKEAEMLNEKYELEIQKVYQQSYEQINVKKDNLLKEESKKLKDVEQQLEKEYESKKAILLEEINKKKQEVATSVDTLSNDLINKLTN